MTPEELQRLRLKQPDIAKYLRKLTSEEMERAFCFIPGICEPPEDIARIFHESKEKIGVRDDLPIIVVPDESHLLKVTNKPFPYAGGLYVPAIAAVVLNESTYKKLGSKDEYIHDSGRFTLVHELKHAYDFIEGEEEKILVESERQATQALSSRFTRRAFLKGVKALSASSVAALILLPDDKLENAFTQTMPSLAFVASLIFALHAKNYTEKKEGVAEFLREKSADIGALEILGAEKAIGVVYSRAVGEMEKRIGRKAVLDLWVNTHRQVRIFCEENNISLPRGLQEMLVQISVAREVFGEGFDTSRYPKAKDTMGYLTAMIEGQLPEGMLKGSHAR